MAAQYFYTFLRILYKLLQTDQLFGPLLMPEVGRDVEKILAVGGEVSVGRRPYRQKALASCWRSNSPEELDQ